MRLIRALLVFFGLFVACALVPACAEPPRGVVVWHAYRGGEQRAIEAIAKRFETEHGVRVTLLAVPYEAYLAKLEAAIPRGNGPDVFLGPHNRLGEYRKNLLVAEAGDAFPDEDVARYEPVTVDAVTEGGKRWAVPLASKCVALYVNTALVAEPPRTLEAIVALQGKLGPGVVPLAYEAYVAYYHAPILHAYGGRIFDRGTFAMTGAAAEASLAMARELVASGVVPAEPSGDLVKQLFAAGKAGTVVSGPWLASDLPGGLAYRVVPLPAIAGAGPMRPLLTVEGAFVTPQGAASREARAFARMLGDEGAAEVRATIGKQVVATLRTWEHLDDPLLGAFHEAAASSVPMPTAQEMQSAWVPVDQALKKVLRGDAEPRAALEEARARYAEFTRPPPPPPSPAPLVLFAGAALLALAVFAARRARGPGFRRELRASRAAYAYVAHAAVTIFVLVVLPLLAGAVTSFYAGGRDAPRFAGLGNYVDILTVRGKPPSEWLSHGSFYLTLLVTVAWTVVNVTMHVLIGIALGLLLARPFVRLRALYRVLLILPWAVPSYVTALAWKGMFHRQFGAVNAVLTAVGADPVSWFSRFSTAFAANVTTNVWLGFPFMMVVVMGALTSIPRDVLEAAEVDGATRWQTFRLVTLPLLRPTLLPAVVLGSVWTFNMFNVVFLVSGGEPDGTTDILVSEAYRWAFARNAQFGYAAAYAVIIFGLLAVMSRLLGRIGGGGGETEAEV
jgi:arabinogalactan oligomer/maltooligosaccharide transport system permease protein